MEMGILQTWQRIFPILQWNKLISFHMEGPKGWYDRAGAIYSTDDSTKPQLD